MLDHDQTCTQRHLEGELFLVMKLLMRLANTKVSKIRFVVMLACLDMAFVLFYLRPEGYTEKLFLATLTTLVVISGPRCQFGLAFLQFKVHGELLDKKYRSIWLVDLAIAAWIFMLSTFPLFFYYANPEYFDGFSITTLFIGIWCLFLGPMVASIAVGAVCMIYNTAGCPESPSPSQSGEKHKDHTNE